MVHEPLGNLFHTVFALLPLALLATFVPLGIPGSGGAQSVPPAVDPAVRTSLQAGRARVIVELRVPAGWDPAARDAAIARAQDAVLARLPRSHASVARRYASIPMLALEVDGSGLAALEAMADAVVSVQADGVARPQ